MPKKRGYEEGSLFVIPMQKEGFVLGLVARTPPRGGGIVLAYFFGQQYSSLPNVDSAKDLSSSDAVRVLLVGDLALIRGEWKVIGKLIDWKRSQWPIPLFVRRDNLTHKAWLVEYSDTNPNEVLTEKQVSYQVTGYEADGVYGYRAAEAALLRSLNKMEN